MGKRLDPRSLVVYRDALGMVLLAKQGDDDGVDTLIASCTTKGRALVALTTIAKMLMDEIDRAGGDSEELVRRWSWNVARWQDAS